MSDHIRLQPISRYRIVHRYGGVTEIRYCDDRSEAITLAVELGGMVEAYVYGIGWQHLNKVMEAEEC
jgi:hypothetical protein